MPDKEDASPGQDGGILQKSNKIRGLRLVLSLLYTVEMRDHISSFHLRPGRHRSSLWALRRARVGSDLARFSVRQAQRHSGHSERLGLCPRGQRPLHVRRGSAHGRSQGFQRAGDWGGPGPGANPSRERRSGRRFFQGEQGVGVSQLRRQSAAAHQPDDEPARSERERELQVRACAARPRNQQPGVGALGGDALRRRRRRRAVLSISAVRRLHRRRRSIGVSRDVPLRGSGTERACIRRRRCESLEATVSQRRRALSVVEGDARPRFLGFDPIDLAGFKLSGGIHYLF